jgi:pimeloyl-ACP methyl ester carboxylesterase
MPIRIVGGVRLNVEEYGSGEPVLLVTGSGASGRVWKAHQVPALTAAGYRAITLDSRGIPPSDGCPEGFTLTGMMEDTASLIEDLGIERCRVVGFSLGAMLVQELLVSYDGLVSQAVLIATRGRSDVLSTQMSAGERDLFEREIEIPPRYAAYMRAIQCLSPRTLSDEQSTQDWLAVFEISTAGSYLNRDHLGLEIISDRRDAYQKIRCPCLVVAFSDDLIARPQLCREVAASIPGCGYTEISGCGHYGYLEDPAAVNDAIIGFFEAGAEPRK